MVFRLERLGERGAEGVGSLALRDEVDRDAGQIEAVEAGILARHVGHRRLGDIEDALPEQAQHLGAAQTELLERSERRGDRAIRLCRERLGEERLVDLLEQVLRLISAGDLEIDLREILRLGAQRRCSKGCQKRQYTNRSLHHSLP